MTRRAGSGSSQAVESGHSDYSMVVRSKTLLLLLPALTLIAGVGLTELAAKHDLSPPPILVVALVASLAGPLVALLVLHAVGPSFDWILIATAAMLTAIGTVTLHSLSLIRGADGTFYQGIAVRHGFFVGTGFLALIVGAIASRRLDELRKYPFTLFGMAIVLTASTVVSGQTVNGARLWLRVGPVQFQPSEVARLLIAGFVAAYLYDHRHLVVAPWRIGPVDLPPAPYLLPLAGAVLAAVAVLAFQNDLGMAALVVLGAFASIATVLSSKRSLGAAGTIVMLGAIMSYAVAPRVRDRVAGWLEPWQDPIGRGFQFVQADYGLSAGGLFGVDSPSLAARVPEVHTDFILVGVATQWGLVGAMAVLAMLSVLVCRCVCAAVNAPSGLHSLLALALATMIGSQVLLIVGGTLRVLPLTGLTVPLVSFGGTSMIATLFALGVVAGIGAPASRKW
jgi:cell division protein FtsW (lipid II flippase)